MSSILDSYRVGKSKSEEPVAKPEQESSSSILDTYRQKPDEGKGSYRNKISGYAYGIEDSVSPKEVVKNVLSGASFGFSEKVPQLKPNEDIPGAEAYKFLGEAIPLAGAFGVSHKGITLLKDAFQLGKIAVTGLGVTAAGGIFGGVEAAKQTARDEDLDVEKIGVAAAEGAALDLGIRGLISAYSQLPKAVQWAKSYLPSHQAEQFANGVIPKDLSPTQYKFFQDEVIPEWLEIAGKEAEETHLSSVEESKKAYSQEVANIRAKHENKLQEIESRYQTEQEEFFRSQQEQSQELANTRAAHENQMVQVEAKKQAAQKEFEAAQQEYQNEMKQVAAEHQSQVQAIEAENKSAMDAYQQANKDYQNMKNRERIVQEALAPKYKGVDLSGRVSNEKGANFFLEIPRPKPRENPLSEKIKNTITKNPIENTSAAGQKNVEVIRANDAFDYQKVNEAYKVSDKLSAQVNETHPGLAQDLLETIKDLQAVPKLSPPQQQLLEVATKTLEQLVEINPTGAIVGYKQMSNRILQEQAKSLRYFMDFNFEHGNARGIFSPTVGQLESAGEFAAINSGNEAAAEASKNARSMYREWAQTYDNPYIRPYRDRTNKDFSKLFNQTANSIDEFRAVNEVLSKSNAGQQLASSTKAELVDRTLAKFTKNPSHIIPEELDAALAELKPVLSQEQTNAIRQEFIKARNSKFDATKHKGIEKPKEPKVKELPQGKVKPFNIKKKEVPEITEVKLPSSKVKPKPEKEVIESVKIPKYEAIGTKESQAAAKKMNITVNDLKSKTNTRQGMEEIKQHLSKTEPGKKLFNKIAEHKIKDIFHMGKVKKKFTGIDLEKPLNNIDNMEILEGILGEQQAHEWLEIAIKLEKKEVTAQNILKLGKKVTAIKSLALMGIL